MHERSDEAEDSKDFKYMNTKSCVRYEGGEEEKGHNDEEIHEDDEGSSILDRGDRGSSGLHRVERAKMYSAILSGLS